MPDRRSIRNPARVVPGRPLDYQLGGEDPTQAHIYKMLQQMQRELTQVINDSDLSGSPNVVIKVTDYTIVSTDGTILGDTSLGEFAFTLPTAVGAKGKTYTVKNIGDPVHDLTVAARVGEEVERAEELVITGQDTALDFRSTGTGWVIVAAYEPSLSAGDAVAGIEPPLNGSGGEGWLSALYLEMVEIRRLLEARALGQLEREEDEGHDES